HDSLVVSIGDGARLDHVRLNEDGREAFNISSASLTLGANAHYNTFGMTSGANVSRYQAMIAFAGEGSRVETNGVNLLNGRQHADSTLFLDHAVPNCESREIFADDVTCGHGATTGALDESLLFYLRARGLSEKEAQALLIQAFVGEAIEAIANDTLSDLAVSAAQRW